jgi:hypothetical protein
MRVRTAILVGLDYQPVGAQVDLEQKINQFYDLFHVEPEHVLSTHFSQAIRPPDPPEDASDPNVDPNYEFIFVVTVASNLSAEKWNILLAELD